MKKKIIRFFLLFPFVILLLIFLYCLLVFYFRDSFGPNTWINGIYGTGQSVEAIHQQLAEEMGVPKVTVKGFDGKEYLIEGAEIALGYDFSTPIHSYMQDMNPFMWFLNTLEGTSIEVQPLVQYDFDLLQAKWESFPFVAKELEREYSARILPGEYGYEFVDGYHNRYDLKYAFDSFVSQIEAGSTYIDLSHIKDDLDVPVGDDYDEIIALWERVQEFQTTGIIYDMGDVQIPLTGKIAAGFILKDGQEFVLDAEGNLIIDEDGITAFVTNLAKEYDTYGMERSWITYDGREITVPEGTYGTKLNQKKEITFIKENLFSEEEMIHVPTYTKEAYVRGKDDIGDTYIEIDMSAQKLFVFQKGEQTIETDIVTGNIKRKWDTPDGMYYVYAKQRNRTLRGEGYESFVKYWMPVNQGIGLHDASWRKKFGGDIYLKDGSHGCINIPKATAAEIYEIVEVGMPVIMYY